MVMLYRGIIFNFHYPDYIVTKFLEFLGSILGGYPGDHINNVVEKLRNATRDDVTVEPHHRALAMQVLVALGFIQVGPSSS